MFASRWKWSAFLLLPILAGVALSQGQEDFETVRKRMQAAKPGIQKKHADLLFERYDLANRPNDGTTMSRGKPVQAGPRTRLHGGMTFKTLAAHSPEEIKAK